VTVVGECGDASTVDISPASVNVSHVRAPARSV